MITAALVQALRSRTGAGMMDCKKALVATGGDLDAAAEAMRKSGQIQAEKKAGRLAAEGIVLVKSNFASGFAIILEVNCETDFVSRDENFQQFAKEVAQCALDNKIDTVEQLLTAALPNGETVEKNREALIAKLGENIQIRRLCLVAIESGAIVGAYVHMGRIGAIVQLKGGNEQLAKDIALHIIASNPLVLAAKDISPHILAKEREIVTAQAETSGKPPAVIDKMVAGRLQKFCDEMSLLGQAFVKDPTVQLSQVLKNANAEVIQFVRFAVGEGIEKPREDFADAVRAQIKESS